MMAEEVPHSLRSPYASLSSPPTRERPLHIVLATTGSVASIKTPMIVDGLLAMENVRIQVIPTATSLHFYNPEAIKMDALSACEEDGWIVTDEGYATADLARQNARAAQSAGVAEGDIDVKPLLHFWQNEDEWQSWKQVGDPILHIELRRWADVVLIAPCSANTLAKINAGLCDDLLTSFLRALSPATPTYLFPAMNTLMHAHPLTATHIRFAQETLGYCVVGPIEKRLACGDLGQGAMQEWCDIVKHIVDRYGLRKRATR